MPTADIRATDPAARCWAPWNRTSVTLVPPAPQSACSGPPEAN